MAVVNVLATTLTNRDAKPQLPNDLRRAGRPFSKREVVTITNGDSVNSTYRFYQIRSSDVVSSIRMSAPDIGTTTAANIGLYETTLNGGGVAEGTAGNASLFASAQAINAGPYTKQEVAIGAGITVANAMKRVWELMGLASDPGKDYDVVMTLTGAADAGGAVLLETELHSL